MSCASSGNLIAWAGACLAFHPSHLDLTWTLCGVAQHADKLATLERREADLKAQHNALANNAQELKDREGELSSFVCL